MTKALMTYHSALQSWRVREAGNGQALSEWLHCRECRPVASPATLERGLATVLAGRGQRRSGPPVWGYQEEWRGGTELQIDGAAVCRRAESEGYEPLGYVRIGDGPHQQHLALCPLPRCNGSWGVLSIPVEDLPGSREVMNSVRLYGLVRVNQLARFFATNSSHPLPGDPPDLALPWQRDLTPLRTTIEGALLATDSPTAAIWRRLGDSDERIASWLALPFGQRVRLPWTPALAKQLRLTALLQAYGGIMECLQQLRDDPKTPARTRVAIVRLVGQLGLGIELKNDRLIISDATMTNVCPLPDAEILALHTQLTRWARRYDHDTSAIDRACASLYMLSLIRHDLQATDTDWVNDPFNDTPDRHCTYTLWSRDPKYDAMLGSWNDAALAADLGTQLFLARTPSGIPWDGLVGSARKNHLTGAYHLVAHRLSLPWYPYGWEGEMLPAHARVSVFYPHLQPTMHTSRRFSSPAEYAAAMRAAYPLLPLGAEMAQIPPPGRVHHHRFAEYSQEVAGQYDALAPFALHPAPPVLVPGVATALQALRGDDWLQRLCVVVVPRPLQLPPPTYDLLRWGFTGQTGRSVTYDLREAKANMPSGNSPDEISGFEFDGIQYSDLSVIGVGRIQAARIGTESRDGQTDMGCARRRFLWSEFLHHVGRPLGLRTARVIGIYNKGIPRGTTMKEIAEGVSPQLGPDERPIDLGALIFELRRTQLRLSHLVGKLESVKEIVRDLRTQLWPELGPQWPMDSDADYVRWLARTIGEQLAILAFLGVDHGLAEGFGQLYADNVSLAGEICDLETARGFAGGRTPQQRYVEANETNGPAHVNLARIVAMEADARANPEEQPTFWVATLVALAPEVQVARLCEAAYWHKRDALEGSGITPTVERRRFFRKRFNPWIRSRHAELIATLADATTLPPV